MSRRWYRVGSIPDMLKSWQNCWTATFGMAGDLTDPKYQDPQVIEANKEYIIDELVANFIANLPAEEVYHAAQERGFTWGRSGPRAALQRRPSA